MEEEKKEEVCCHHEHKHYKCCGCKVGKVLILILAILVIFSLGACFGYYLNNHNNYNNRNFNFREFDNQEIGGRMMKNGSGFLRNGGGYSLEETVTQTVPAQINCPMQTQIQNPVPVVQSTTKTANPAK